MNPAGRQTGKSRMVTAPDGRQCRAREGSLRVRYSTNPYARQLACTTRKPAGIIASINRGTRSRSGDPFLAGDRPEPGQRPVLGDPDRAGRHAEGMAGLLGRHAGHHAQDQQLALVQR